MVSKEKYKEYVRQLISKDVDNVHLKCLSKKYYSITFTVSFLFSFFLCFCFYLFFLHLFLLGFVSLFAFAISGLILARRGYLIDKARKYYKSYRDMVMNYLFSDYTYEFRENEKINQSIFLDSQFGECYNSYKGSDLLIINIPNDDNSISNVNLSLCDLDVAIMGRSSLDRRATVYNGVFGYVEFPFKFKHLLCLNSDYKKKDVVLKDIKLEDVYFSENFRVLCDDQIEARYILTPDMMSKLIYLNNKLGKIKITLVDNKLYIGIIGVNLFELKNMKDYKLETMFEKFYDDVKTVLDIFNEIKNNNKIFKM